MREKKLLSYPLTTTVVYLLATVFLFVFGPIKWSVPSYPKVVIVLLIYILAFALGYLYRRNKILFRSNSTQLQELCDPDQKTFGILGGLDQRYIVFIFTVSCLYSIVRCGIFLVHFYGGINFSALFQMNLTEAYFDRLQSEVAGTWYILLLSLTHLLDTFWYILGILYFKKFHLGYKLLFLAALLMNVLLTANSGTMIDWAVFVFKLIPFFFIARYKSKYSSSAQQKKKNKRVGVVILVLAIAFVILFTTIQESRYQHLTGEELSYENDDLVYFIDEVKPWPILNSIVYPVDFYITHGYCGMAHALELPAEFTYGIGFSRDFAKNVKAYTGLDVSQKTYPQRLEDATGWDNGMYWPSAYTWFASDWTFWGIPLLMFLFGIFLCNVWYSALFENSIIATTLFSWLWIGIIFIPANNQLFQSFQMFMATVCLLVLYLFRKFLPKITF